MKDIITPLAIIANVNKEEFFSKIQEENKAKSWTISPVKIDFKNGKIVHNADKIKEIVKTLQSWSKYELEKANLATLKDDESVVRTIYTWFKGSRTQLTKPLDELKKEFTGIEKELSEVIANFKQKQDELQLIDYQAKQEILETEIKVKQKEINEQYNLDLDFTSILKEWVLRKRKTQISTDKGKIKKAITDEIDREIENYIKPILEERAKKEEQDRQLQSLTLDLQEIDCQGNPGEAIIKLESLKTQIEIKYPSIVDIANSNINANIKIAQNVIEKQKRDEKDRQLQVIEQSLIAEVKQYHEKTKNTNDIATLEAELANIRDARGRAELADTIKQIDEIGLSVKDKINSLKAEEIKKAQPKKEEPKKEAKLSPLWHIELNDLEVLSLMGVEAQTEDEAKAKLIEVFKSILDFATLKKEEA